MNNLAFQIYGTKKASPFQSVWDTRISGAVGTELASIAATAPLFNWSGTNLLTGGYTHTTGIPGTLLFNSLTPTAGQSYQIVSTLSVGTTGSLVINWGGVSSVPISATTTITLTPINGTSKLSITPSNNFTGNVRLSIKASSSAANQIQLPIGVASGKSIWVDWGDNSYSTMNSINHTANRIHTYSTPGEYTVRILGDNFNFVFGYLTINDKLKIKSISSWGKLKMGAASFLDCSNVTMSGITDVPDLTGVSDINLLVAGCTNITTIGRINEWNTSSITNMGSVFSNCTNFNSDISNWNVGRVTYFLNMFNNCSKFNNGYAPGVYNQLPWTINTSVDVNIQGMFQNAASFNANLGTGTIPWNFSKVSNMTNMFINASKFNNGFASGDGIGNQLPWNTSACTTMASMFSNATAFNSNLGTGTTPWDVSKVTTFTNMFNGASNFNNGDEADVTKSKITDWNIGGSVTSVNMTSMFSNADAFNRLIGNWNMTKVNNTSSMLAYTNIFNQPLSNWERSGSTMANVTDMNSMFAGSKGFNQDISNWNVSGVTIFSSMFFDATLFNNGSDTNTNLITGRIGIDGWNINTASTASVNMSSMFGGGGGNGYVTFDRPIGNWNTSRVNNMSNMFGKSGNGNHAFNQYIGDWDTSNVTNMSFMFKAGQGDGTTSKFNQDISKWNVGKVTTFESMFKGQSASASAFNNKLNENTNLITGRIGIDGWNINTASTASVNMQSMFDTTPFNQYIGSWDVSRVNNMSLMFGYNNQFNQDISKWNVSGVTNFGQMFQNATVFNNKLNENTNPVTGLQGIDGWNINTTATSVNMSSMFADASAFNQPISSWNVGKVTYMGRMFWNADSFNQPLSGWERTTIGNVSSLNKVSSMESMFRFTSVFNQPIGNWNVSEVTNMSYMFEQAAAFNQPLANWERVSSPDTSTLAKVTNMAYMFSSNPLNQNIGNWNISGVTNFTGFMQTRDPATFSSTNLDAIYNGWIVNGVKPNITISFGTAKYTSAGVSGRNTLTGASNNWTIADGGNAGLILNLDAGNIASYPGTGTTWTDLSGNNNNGTLVNGPTFDSANGGSIVFDSVNQYVNCGSASNLKFTSNFTINVWVKFNTLLGKQTVISNNENGGYGIIANLDSSRLETQYWINGSYRKAGEDMSNYNTSSWFNISVTFNGSNVLFYRNGNLIQNVSAIGTVSTTNEPLTIGANPAGNGTSFSDFFNGKISQVQTYNRVLTPTEILANFNATKGIYGL